ncbi:MAG: (d)CMP kinase [Phycisphaerae bacterium]|jgi:CMP/dCMP kinase|nr:(d)CMP kinase [Phycisphaerae bacterium]HJN71753.1 (d)CMP kinase [Phycisphaerales bacterium]|tara:strand:- start:5667 stop:6365 length:699 start_codon:yes stop_codon:yes gene_type:complete
MPQDHRLVVTIDGAAGTGKTSVARELARRLGTDCLDTGAMYRAVAVIAVDQGIDPSDGQTLARLVTEQGIRFDWSQSPPPILLAGKDISVRIRDLDVSSVVSIVAEQSEIRKVLVEQQRKISQDHPTLVTEGRDQGSVVFPDAAAQFYLEAAMEERTKRRLLQLQESGTNIDAETVALDITSRDKIDSSREDSPLTCPSSAIVIDTSDKTMLEVVDIMEQVVREHLAALDHA